MHLEDFKRWHWAVIGVVVGGLFALASLALNTPDQGRGESLNQTAFELELLFRASNEQDIERQRGALQAPRGGPREGKLPRLRNLTVYPADRDGRMIVTGERLVRILPQRTDPADPARVLPAAAEYTTFFYR